MNRESIGARNLVVNLTANSPAVAHSPEVDEKLLLIVVSLCFDFVFVVGCFFDLVFVVSLCVFDLDYGSGLV